MTTITLSLPNDYASASHEDAMIAAIYGGDIDACNADSGLAALEELAVCAKSAGLEFVRATDFGAEWSGTDAQIEALEIPEWADKS